MASVTPRRAIHNAAPHQTGDQIDEQNGGAAAIVEKRIEFDEIEARTQAAVVQHLHDEMRFAKRRAARHGGADPRGDSGIEKIDVETDVKNSLRRGDTLQETIE